MAYVYAFKLYNEAEGEFEVQPYKATIEEIQRECGLPIVPSKQQIPNSMIENGKYY